MATTHLKILKPFIYSDVVDVGGTDFVFYINANKNVVGTSLHVNSTVATTLNSLGVTQTVV
jgi:hypothetical protein